MCLIALTWTGSTVYDIELSLVERRAPPPSANSQVFWQPQNTLQNVLRTVILVGSNALMVCLIPLSSSFPLDLNHAQVYRIYSIYGGSPITTSLCIVIYLSFIAIAIVKNLVHFSTQFGGPLALPNVHNISTAYFCLTASLNVLVSILIAAKLLYFRRLSAMYMSIVAIVVESAALYTTCSVIFVILDNVRSPAGFWFGAVVNCSAVRFPFLWNPRGTDRVTVPESRLDYPARRNWIQQQRWWNDYVHARSE
jgi:hypothetical protein